MTLLFRSLWWVAVALLIWTPHVRSRNVTHEDIRDAMLSLVHMFRTSEDKLERHEYRERALGENIKKMLGGLERKHRALEPLKGMLSRLDERLSNVETILLQKEEREKSTQKKTNEILEGLQKSLQSLTEAVGKPSGGDAGKLDTIVKDVDALKNTFNKDSLRTVCLELAAEGNPYEKHISETEKLLNKYELKLNEFNGTSSKVQTEFVPLSEVSLADEAWHSKMTEVMERQEKEVQKIQQLLSDAESMWKDLPRLADLQQSTNQTLDALQVARNELKENDDKSVDKVAGKLRELGDRLATTNEDIQRSLTQGNELTEKAYTSITKSYEGLRDEVQTLTKNEKVMLQTADNVLATKKQIGFSVQLILSEVREMIKHQGRDLNRTFHERLDGVEATLMSNHSFALTNLSGKIESEMSQVWRQIGIMYNELTASKALLDKLTDQTENYVNGSVTSMDSMKNKVDQITTKMVDVEENLNFLLGRLSLVTQEFSQIKTGLGDALDQVKTNLGTVQSKLQDAGSGPHPITSAEQPSANTK